MRKLTSMRMVILGQSGDKRRNSQLSSRDRRQHLGLVAVAGWRKRVSLGIIGLAGGPQDRQGDVISCLWWDEKWGSLG